MAAETHQYNRIEASALTEMKMDIHDDDKLVLKDEKLRTFKNPRKNSEKNTTRRNKKKNAK